MPEKKYPYQNLSLRSIKGETWKPIKGFEGLYEVSSFGRVKTLKRSYTNNIGASVPIKERILKTQVTKRKSKTVPHDSYVLSAGLCRDGIRTSVFIARLVYDLFVEPIDLNDRSILISYKDWEGRNIRPGNLLRTTISEIMKASHASHRYEARLSKDSKKVSQFDTDGNFIATFESIITASQHTGIVANGISRVANGTLQMYKGFVWQLGSSKRLRRKNPIKEKNGGINDKLLLLINKGASTKNIPALADLRVQNRKGEIWKSIEGFEGYYEISNYGRIKALSRVSKGDKQYLRPEMIKTISFKSHQNAATANLRTGSLWVNLRKERLRRSFGIAHLVYHTFIRPLAPKERSKRMYYRDSNHFNLEPDNLYFQDKI